MGREIALDLDMVSAAAPEADILLVETDNDDLRNLAAGVDEAVILGAKYVSNSYGRTGDYPTDLATYGSSYDHPGVAVVAASGDNKYGVSFPATLPSVTAVGGTTLTADPAGARGWSETVWARDSYGPGSGCASNQTKPDFQQDTGCTGRSVADVSAVADNVAVYLTYGSQGKGWQRFGGTSVATPLIASIYALAGPPRPGTSPTPIPTPRMASVSTTSPRGRTEPAPSRTCATPAPATTVRPAWAPRPAWPLSAADRTAPSPGRSRTRSPASRSPTRPSGPGWTSPRPTRRGHTRSTSPRARSRT